MVSWVGTLFSLPSFILLVYILSPFPTFWFLRLRNQIRRGIMLFLFYQMCLWSRRGWLYNCTNTTHLTSVHTCLHFCANLIRKTVLVAVLTGTARKSFQFYTGSVITLLIIFMSAKQSLEKVCIQNSKIPPVVYCSQFSEYLLFFIWVKLPLYLFLCTKFQTNNSQIIVFPSLLTLFSVRRWLWKGHLSFLSQFRIYSQPNAHLKKIIFHVLFRVFTRNLCIKRGLTGKNRRQLVNSYRWVNVNVNKLGIYTEAAPTLAASPGAFPRAPAQEKAFLMKALKCRKGK